jgi:hypothetical protein
MKKIDILIFVLLCLVASTRAWAVAEGTSCAGQPEGSSVVEQNSDRRTRFVCDGAAYHELESWSANGFQTVRLGKANGYSALIPACSSAQEGILMYDKAINKMLFCNGLAWQAVGLTIYIPGL